ncbi:MAG: phosphatidate cytidylyltransferase [Candidatus Omnitrophica bacterium]|nr:phosphatidate cytidylyltransferase [Candidatus Omnitrophota bacterium]
MTTLVKRCISSFVVLAVAGCIIFYCPNWVYLILTMSFIVLAANELFLIVERKGIFVYKYFGIGAASLIPVSIYLHLGENYTDIEPLLIVVACLFAFILQFVRREKAQDHLVSIAVTLLVLFYVSWFFSFFIKLKFIPDIGGRLVVFLILVTKIGDVAAYFIGKAAGRHKLIPRISPKKTVEGTIGGLLASIIMAVLLGQALALELGNMLFVGLFLGVLGQVGDLAESLIKRDCDVKDSGASVPGFGGVMDLIDSLLFTVPIFYFYVKMVL